MGQRHSRQGKGWVKVQMQQEELSSRSGISGCDLRAVGRGQGAEGPEPGHSSPQGTLKMTFTHTAAQSTIPKCLLLHPKLEQNPQAGDG